MTTIPVADFDRLESRLRLSGVLTTRTALRVGSGGGGGATEASDLPVMRDADGFPFIPGASLKGSFRSTIEGLVRGANAPGLFACDPLMKGCGDHQPGKRQTVKVESHCAVCRLLGSHVLASHVRFTDALAIATPEARRARRAPIEIRDGVAIDRDLKVVYRNQKYDFEVVSPGARFGLEVFVENPQPWLMGLLVIGFDQVADGFTALGGFTSRGMGRVELEWTELTTVTAMDLLNGKPPQRVERAGLENKFKEWRQALGEQLKEMRNVS
jgi:CRISPR-associated protein Csm3